MLLSLDMSTRSVNILLRLPSRMSDCSESVISIEFLAGTRHCWCGTTRGLPKLPVRASDGDGWRASAGPLGIGRLDDSSEINNFRRRRQ